MYPTPPNHRKQKALASFVLVFAVLMVMGSVSAYEKRPKSSPVTAPATSQVSTTTTTPTQTGASSSASSGSGYKDGSYSASSDYYVPDGSESIKVTLTIADGVVTNSQITNSEGNRESAQYQQAFAGSYKSYVVGKKLSDIHLSYVAGASDTTDGFNTALQQIASQAQA